MLSTGLLVVCIDGIVEVYQAALLTTATAPDHNGTLGNDPFSQSKGIPSDVAVRHMQQTLLLSWVVKNAYNILQLASTPSALIVPALQ